MGKVLISIGGPTGIGKTTWAIGLARHYRAEILSADSRQFYREIPIGTASPTLSEQEQAPHHFVGHLSVHDTYSVGDFRRDALERLRNLFKTHDIAILVGGSGLYLDAVTRGLDEFPEVEARIRRELNALWQDQGLGALQEMLREKDPEYYSAVDRQNPHRLIRALEVCLVAGRPYSSFLGKRKAPEFFKTIRLGIDAPRETVYRRIEQRVQAMVKAGLEAEARSLYPYRDLNALQTVGYQEFFAYFDGKYDRDTALEEIAKNTRRFAKRQLTWFRKDPEIHWIPYDAPLDQAIEYIDAQMKNLRHG
ncbi:MULTISPECIES: tRNA (adenosine(37)-N6)-dimethylallyltransferase MiaA [Robiginitalea]|uniref:tRNA dimethylallyltransferase n=1 Tax=Robiginitalea biformata (strain ATCC BAA-864 / DSM 15991 / KCTC 12146 / HTCC2501) TaxID=313596 RepID=A4CLU1_ROBBH|nr:MULTISPECIES: tRNA (adenosine(37)-N6)-dimethylallyltransferase MiaA [Robiginitalea]EAR15840.1 tRNA delta(2)-isopentenylpyrophosphate transferase [Robiginitalea biformata HTCC2501]MDC6354263.1 tRNA (adenosine(37)-N6)-dimethylallyltransferase MiaA [Robiginitalea sp. PM2]MDC6374530.1 tRNA (adenosine(37)-N6)-dimethylallyltransferase MiaA [Robiginitalea sp. SP8]